MNGEQGTGGQGGDAILKDPKGEKHDQKRTEEVKEEAGQVEPEGIAPPKGIIHGEGQGGHGPLAEPGKPGTRSPGKIPGGP